MLKPLPLLLLLSTPALLQCGPDAANDEANSREAFHRERDFIPDQGKVPWYWVEDDQEPQDYAALDPQQASRARQLQWYLDAMFQRARAVAEQTGVSFAHVPPPKLRLDESFGAHGTARQRSFPIPLRYSTCPVRGPGVMNPCTEEKVSLLFHSGRTKVSQLAAPTSFPDEDFARAGQTPSDIAASVKDWLGPRELDLSRLDPSTKWTMREVLHWINTLSKETKFSSYSSEQLKIFDGEGLAFDPNHRYEVRFIVFPALPTFTVGGQLLEALTRSEAVVVLAHELAHYLHSDNIRGHQFYYFYDYAKHATPSWPETLGEDASGQLAEQAHRLENMRQGSYFRTAQVSGARYDRFVALTATSTGFNHLLLDDPSLDSGCKARWSQLAAFVTANRDTLEASESDHDRYLQFDARLEEAASCTRLQGAGTITAAEEVIKALANKYANLVRGSLAVRDAYAAKLSSLATLDDLLLQVSRDVVALARDALAFNQKLSTMGIGYYTYEQAADELSLELLSLVGIDPQMAIDALFKMGDYLEARSREGRSALDPTAMASCRQLYAQWREDPTKVLVPVGNLSEPHHDTCFRIFNMVHEGKLHRYPVADFPLPRWLEEAAW